MTRVDPLLEAFGLATLWRRRQSEAPAAVTARSRTLTPEALAVRTQEQEERQTLELQARDVRTLEPQAPKPQVLEPQALEPQALEPQALEPQMLHLTPAADAPPVASLDFDALRERVLGCTACRLCETRTQAVFGVGDRQADWMFVGEGPGATEDQVGEPFVGQAGKLLDNMMRALGLSRQTGVFIANVVKCRPPGNRDPLPDEVAACEHYLRRQIALIQPRIIVALGKFAAQTLLKRDATIGAMRGAVHAYASVPVVVTYHPAYLLRTLTDKAKAWEDLCLARSVYRDAAAADGASGASGAGKDAVGNAAGSAARAAPASPRA